MAGVLPNLIIIGAMKCGTSSLHNYLNEHPDINLTKVKELDYFIEEKNYKMGLAWYKNNFDDKFKINGESSPNYSKNHIFKRVPERMSEVIPNAKLIYLIRHPVDRFVSHYHQSVINNREDRNLQEVLSEARETNYFKTGLYHDQLKSYLKYFNKKQIMLIKSDDLKNRRVSIMQQIFDFLGIKNDNLNISFEYESHITSQRGKKPEILSGLLRTKLGKTLKKITPRVVIGKFHHIFEKKIDYPVLKEKERAILLSYFKNDIKLLESYWEIKTGWI